MAALKERLKMNKLDFVAKVGEAVRRSGYKKKVPIPKTVFTISDNQGTERDFEVKRKDKEVAIFNDDVAAVVDACIECIWDLLSRGETLHINGIGELGTKLRRSYVGGGFTEDRTRGVKPGVRKYEARYVPYFYPSNKLRVICKLYGADLVAELNEEEHAKYLEELAALKESGTDEDDMTETEGDPDAL